MLKQSPVWLSLEKYQFLNSQNNNTDKNWDATFMEIIDKRFSGLYM